LATRLDLLHILVEDSSVDLFFSFFSLISILPMLQRYQVQEQRLGYFCCRILCYGFVNAIFVALVIVYGEPSMYSAIAVVEEILIVFPP
jgi:hypothetical protein